MHAPIYDPSWADDVEKTSGRNRRSPTSLPLGTLIDSSVLMRVKLMPVRKTVAVHDLPIAVTALVIGYQVATRDMRSFPKIPRSSASSSGDSVSFSQPATRSRVDRNSATRITERWTMTVVSAPKAAGSRRDSDGDRPPGPGEELSQPREMGGEALSLVDRLTLESWSLSGREFPAYTRAHTPYRLCTDGRRDRAARGLSRSAYRAV